MYSAMEALRNALSDIDGVSSCKIGYEANISPEDYPIIRIVPSLATPGKPFNYRDVETLIYFGDNTTNSQGLELVYQNLDLLEEEILQTIKAQSGVYVETIYDQDRGLQAGSPYKLSAIRCRIKANRPVLNYHKTIISGQKITAEQGGI